MEKKQRILLIIVGLILVYIGLIVYYFIPTKPDIYIVDGEKIKLDPGDVLEIDCWNAEDDRLNICRDKTIYKGIKIGSSKEKVIRRYGLNSKNAKYDCEVVNPAGDGTTDIIYGRFTRKIFKKAYLDCDLIFAYKDGKMLSYDELDNLDENSKDSRGIIKYEIDINGFPENAVGEGNVIKFVITKY